MNTPENASADKRVQALEERVRKLEEWEKTLTAQDRQQLNELRIALLDDANSWTQHYSNVRLGLTTFLVTIALGIMQFKWENPTPVIFWSCGTIWFVAVVLFGYFSWLEAKQVRKA